MMYEITVGQGQILVHCDEPEAIRLAYEYNKYRKSHETTDIIAEGKIVYTIRNGKQLGES